MFNTKQSYSLCYRLDVYVLCFTEGPLTVKLFYYNKHYRNIDQYACTQDNHMNVSVNEYSPCIMK